VSPNFTNPHWHLLLRRKRVDNGNSGEKEGELIYWNCVPSFSVTSFSALTKKQATPRPINFPSFILPSLQTLGCSTSITEKAH